MEKFEIVELGYPQSIIQRENEPISELIDIECLISLLKTRIKELEQTIENMKAISINIQQPDQCHTITSVDYPSDNETEIQLQFAEQQIIGYSYGRSEPSITTLFDGMNLTKDEWLKIKDSISKYITPYDIKDIERYYKNK